MMRPPAQNKDDASALWYYKEYIGAAVARNADYASPAQGFFDWSNGGPAAAYCIAR